MKFLEDFITKDNYEDVRVRSIQHNNSSMLYTFNKDCSKLITLNEMSTIATPTIQKKLFSDAQYLCITSQNIQEMTYDTLKQYLLTQTIDNVRNMTIYDLNEKVTYKFFDDKMRFENSSEKYLPEELLLHLTSEYKVVLCLNDNFDNPFELLIKEICVRKVVKQSNEKIEMNNYRHSIVDDQTFETAFKPLMNDVYLAGLYFVKNGKIIGSFKDKSVFYHNSVYEKNINAGPFNIVSKEINEYRESVDYFKQEYPDKLVELFIEKLLSITFLELNSDFVEKAYENNDLMVSLMTQINEIGLTAIYS